MPGILYGIHTPRQPEELYGNEQIGALHGRQRHIHVRNGGHHDLNIMIPYRETLGRLRVHLNMYLVILFLFFLLKMRRNTLISAVSPRKKNYLSLHNIHNLLLKM